MEIRDDAYDLLRKYSYIDEMTSYFHDTNDSSILCMLMDDPSYADIMLNKFYYRDRRSLMKDMDNYDTFVHHVDEVRAKHAYWINCARHSRKHITSRIHFMYVMAGRCYCHMNNEDVWMNSGDVCIIPAGIELSHDGYGEDCLLIHIEVAEEYMKRTLVSKLPQAGPIPTQFHQQLLEPKLKKYQTISNSDKDKLNSLFLNALYEYRYKRVYYYEVLDSYFVLLATEFMRAMTKAATTNQYARTASDKRIIDIHRFIDENFSVVTLDMAAEHFHFTPSYLSSFVSRHTGTTFTKLVQEVRLQQAARLLLHSSYKISDIAANCGYQNISYFYRLFSTKYGCSPADYRERNYGIDTGEAITDNTLPE